MKIDNVVMEELSKLQEELNQRAKLEQIATATQTSEILSQLNISIESLPQRCQHLLQECGSLQAALDVDQLNPIAISLKQTRVTAGRMEEEYELLELRQKNMVLQRQIDRNKKVIEELKRELQSSRESLQNQNPSPDNIHEHLRQMKQKLASYEEIYVKAKSKYTKLKVPDAILPKSIEELATKLASLKAEEESLRQRAEDITLAREARETLIKLRR